MMDIEPRPAKKRRFFVEDPPPTETSLPDEVNALPETTFGVQTELADNARALSDRCEATKPDTSSSAGPASVFDNDLFASFVGESVSADTIQKLQEISGNNMERAINMYLDGSWVQPAAATSSTALPSAGRAAITTNGQSTGAERYSRSTLESQSPSQAFQSRVTQSAAVPDHRYVGALGVEAWATRSGTNLVQHGETVKIERTKIKPQMKKGRGGKIVQVPSNASRTRTDIIVRFTNTKGEEIGRLTKEAAAWISVLIDQQICRFDGTCVYAPERLRINDTILLQLRCSLLRRAFEIGGFVKPTDNNRTTGIFEEKETSEEKDLRLRQVALVKLFDEVNLQPSSVNETTAKHKRQGLLHAAEIAEQYDKNDDGKTPKSSDNGGSSPPADDEAEEGKELEEGTQVLLRLL